MTEVLRAAAEHRGTSLVEIYQNCPVFNDGAFFAMTEKETRDVNQIRLVAGEPIRFGVDHERGVAMRQDGAIEIVDVAIHGEDGLLVHDPGREDPGVAFALAKLSSDPTGPTPIGTFRDVERRVYARTSTSSEAATTDQLEELLHAGDTWAVS
jgi:2-oxoglutarate ferredoxin oxidoreductase subunit beta